MTDKILTNTFDGTAFYLDKLDQGQKLGQIFHCMFLKGFFWLTQNFSEYLHQLSYTRDNNTGPAGLDKTCHKIGYPDNWLEEFRISDFL